MINKIKSIISKISNVVSKKSSKVQTHSKTASPQIETPNIQQKNISNHTRTITPVVDNVPVQAKSIKDIKSATLSNRMIAKPLNNTPAISKSESNLANRQASNNIEQVKQNIQVNNLSQQSKIVKE